jgi:hypothetical protein
MLSLKIRKKKKLDQYRKCKLKIWSNIKKFNNYDLGSKLLLVKNHFVLKIGVSFLCKSLNIECQGTLVGEQDSKLKKNKIFIDFLD